MTGLPINPKLRTPAEASADAELTTTHAAGRFAAHPVALALVALAVATQLIGVWLPIDGTVWGTVFARPWAPLDRGDTPTVIAIDDATVARLGPPPWAPSTWRTIAEAAQSQGFESVVLADPWPRLIAANGVDPQDTLPGTLLQVPATTWDARKTPKVPESLDRLLSPVPLQIDVATNGTGRAVPIPADATTRAGCTTASCPPGAAILLNSSDVQVLSMLVLLDAKPGFLAAGKAGLWIGMTASPYADVVATPYAPKPIPYVLAEAQTAAAAAAGRIARPFAWEAAVAWLLALHAITSVSMWLRPSRRWMLAAPALGTGAALVMGMVTRLEIPLVAGAIATLAAPIGAWVRHSRTHEVTLARVGLMVARSASRAGTLRKRITNEDDLLSTVVDLTKVHAPSEGCVLLVALPGRGGWSVHGGRNLTARDVRPEALRYEHSELRLAVTTMEATRALSVLQTGPALVVPLRQGRATVALWVLTNSSSDPTGFVRRVHPFAKWLSDRLALPRTGAAGAHAGDLLQTSTQDDALDTMFGAVDEERRRWLLAVRNLGHPVFVADTAGSVSLLNTAMESALIAADLPRFRNVHEMATRLGVSVPGLADRLSAMFSEGRSLALPWPGPMDRTLVLRPIVDSQGHDGEAHVLGFIGWLDDERTDPGVRRRL